MNKVKNKLINMYDLITCLTNACDLINPQLVNHHQQVGYLALKIGEELRLPKKQLKDLILAGLLHDVGALEYHERLELIESEPPTAQSHAFKGARLLEGFSYLKNAAGIIRYHHVPWNNGEGATYDGQDIPLLSHIIHLADRVAVQIDRNKGVLGQVKGILKNIQSQKNTNFMPELVDALNTISSHEYIWLDMVNHYLPNIIMDTMLFGTMDLSIEETIELANIFAKIIDFRSPYTAKHSAGVAKTAEKLAELAGFSDIECKMMLIAGYLHDLGKLAIPNDVLEKPSKLDTDELNIIKCHTYYTYRLLQPIKEFEEIAIWAASHHEKLNGEGYPFHLHDQCIPLGSRIMAVADVFTAITEDRPYRKGMSYEETVKVLNSMAESKSICPYVVSILIDNFDLIDKIRMDAQQKVSFDYNRYVNS
ncbi:MAG: HD domain-containing protein [Firmicutes bacterium]|nr:HD domain-containing protein [Bacillota bacterium]